MCRWPRGLIALAFILGVFVAASGVPSHADPQAELTTNMPDGAVLDPDSDYDDYVLFVPDASAHTPYSFTGTAQWSEDPFRVSVYGYEAPNEERTPVCHSAELEPESQSQDWSCSFDATAQQPGPSYFEFTAELEVDGQEDPLETAVVGVSVLNTPSASAVDVAADGDTASLVGDRPLDMGVEVFDGKLSGPDGGSAAEPLCADTDGASTWSCEIDTSAWDAGSRTVSARYVPVNNEEFSSGFQTSSDFRWVTVEKPGLEPDPEPEPEPAPEHSGQTPSAQNPGTSSGPPDAVGHEAHSSKEPRSESAQDPIGEPADSALSEEDEDVSRRFAGTSDYPEHDSSQRAEKLVPDVKGVVSTTGAPAATPSSFGRELRRVSNVASTPAAVIGGAALVSGAFVMFVALPSELLHATLRQNYRRAFNRLTRGWQHATRMLPAMAQVPFPPWFRVVSVLTAASVISAGAMASSADPIIIVRLTAAMFAAFMTTNGLSIVTSWLMGRRFAMWPQLTLMPGFLLLSALSVVFSRLAGLQPAILFGILMVVTFGKALPRNQQGVLSTVLSGTFLGIGVFAWFVYSLIDSGRTGMTVEFLREYLTTLATGGIGYCVVALLPLTYLEGIAIFRWSKSLWAVLYISVIVIFQLTVVRMPGSWQEMSGATMLWCTAFGTFGVVSVAVWAWFRFRTSPTDAVRVNAE